jgi:hypothetical protein
MMSEPALVDKLFSHADGALAGQDLKGEQIANLKPMVRAVGACCPCQSSFAPETCATQASLPAGHRNGGGNSPD